MVQPRIIQFFKAPRKNKTQQPLTVAFSPRQKTPADLRLWATSVSARRLALERLDVSGVVFGDVEDAPHWYVGKNYPEPQQNAGFSRAVMN